MLLALLAAALAAVVYANALHSPFVYDDRTEVRENQSIPQLTNPTIDPFSTTSVQSSNTNGFDRALKYAAAATATKIIWGQDLADERGAQHGAGIETTWVR